MSWLGPKVYHKKKRRRPKRKKKGGMAKGKLSSAELWLYRARKQKKALKKTEEHLQKNVPASEIWFRKYYIPDQHDRYNVIYGHYIPDVQNAYFKYIIEIDGGYHDSIKQMKKDMKKNEYFYKEGYIVIRIKAYDMDSLRKGLRRVLQLRGIHVDPVLDDNTAAGCPHEGLSQTQALEKSIATEGDTSGRPDLPDGCVQDLPTAPE